MENVSRDIVKSEYNFHCFVHHDASGKLQDYRMRRLTFGVTSSPYLASRVLLQLADDHKKECHSMIIVEQK